MLFDFQVNILSLIIHYINNNKQSHLSAEYYNIQPLADRLACSPSKALIVSTDDVKRVYTFDTHRNMTRIPIYIFTGFSQITHLYCKYSSD